jgi:PAS domain S-box-containing protein
VEAIVSGRTAELRRATEALEQERAFSSAVLDTAGALVVVTDREGRIVRFNRACEETTGWTAEEVKGRPVWDVFVGEDEVDAVRAVFQDLRAGQFPRDHENHWVTKTGERRLISWSNTALLDSHGAVEYVVATGIDVTEQRRAERQLQERHDRLEQQVERRTAQLRHRLAFENLISKISADFINRAPGETDEGINQALEAVGSFMNVDRSYVFLFSDDRETMHNTHEWCAEGIAPQIDHMKHVPVDDLRWSNDILLSGQVLHIPSVADLPPEAHDERVAFQAQGNQSMVAVPMVSQGRTIGLVGFDAVRRARSWSDESIKLLRMLATNLVSALERWRADRALRESERMLSTLISNLPGMAYRCRNDARCTMTFVSEGSLELTGYRPHQLIENREVAYAKLIHPDDREAVRKAVQAALHEQRHFEITYRIVTPEGERWVWERGQGVYTGAERPTMVEGFITDITERVTARQHLEQRVAERTRELATLLEISHDVASTLELEHLLGLILDHLGEVVAYDAASTMILRDDTLSIAAYRGPIPRDEALGLRFSLDEAEANRAVIERREPIIVDDLHGDAPLARAIRETAGEQLGTTYSYIRAWMGVPLVVKERVVGMLSLDHREPGYYTAEQAELAMAFANQVAVAIDNARLYEAEQERLKESERRRCVAEGLRDILSILNSNRALEEVLDAIVDQALQLLGADGGAVYRLSQAKEEVNIVTAAGMPRTFTDIGAFPLAPTAVHRAVLQHRPFAVPDFSQMEPPEALDELPSSVHHLSTIVRNHFRASLTVPLIVEGELYGAVTLYYAEPHAFSDEETELVLSFADQAALAVANARLRDEVEEAAVMAERSRLARDLHDAVTQTLFSSSLIADVLPRIWEANPEEGRRRLEELRELTRGALAEMRTLLLELRPAALVDAELSELLRQLGESITGRARVPVSVDVVGDCDPPEEVKVAFYRIAQESLNNVAKHAGATRATVRLRCEPGRVALRIRDDGSGFDADSVPPDSLGLGIMRERADKIDAALTIETHPAHGTEISVDWTVPCTCQASEAKP